MSRKLWLLTAALLFVTGLGLLWIQRAGTDLPPLPEGQAPSAREFSEALAKGQAPFATEFAVTAQRGQAPYDARIIGLESLGLEVLVLALVLGLLAPELTFGELLVVTVGAVLCLILSPFAPRPEALSSGLGVLTRTLPASDLRALHSFWETFSTLLPWGHAGFLWALLVSIPSIMLSLSSVEDVRAHRFDHYRVVSLFGLLSVGGIFLLAGFGAQPAAAQMLVFSAVLLNCACFVAQPRGPILTALWFMAVLIPFLDPLPVSVPFATLPTTQTAQLRQAVALGKIYADEATRRVLPESIRPPIDLSANGTTVFAPGGAPPLAGLDGLPTWGTWKNGDGPYPVGEITTTPFPSQTGIIQIRVAGTFQPPATDLFLRGADGRAFYSLSDAVSAPARWRHINFEVPDGLYQIVARSRDAHHWLAFSAPLSIDPWARRANKCVQTWPWWLAAAAVISALLARPVWRSPRTLALPSVPAPILRAAPWLSLAAYAILLWHHVDGTAGPNDSGGYLNSAKLLASHHLTAAPRPVLPGPLPAPLTPILPITFVASPDGRMAPTYPIGFPLIVATLAQALPLAAAVQLTIWLQICLGVWVTYLLAREFDLSTGWSWLAGAIIGLSPVYLFQALQPQSDGPALLWVTLAVYLAWTSSRHPWRALLAGLATAMAVLIRPSNALCLLPLSLCFWGQRRRALLWVLGGVPGAAFQFWVNHRLYGHGLSTGYGDPGAVSSNFGLRYALLTWHSYARWLPAFFTPLIVLSLVGPWIPALPRRSRWVLGTWAAVFVLFYTFYWCTYDNWYNMRFILPAAPALVILGLWTTRWMLARVPLPLWGRTAAVIVLLLFSVRRSIQERVFYWMAVNHIHAEASLWARDHLPPNAVVVGRHITGSLFYYTDLAFLRTDTPLAQSPATYTALAQAGRPVYALTFHWERKGFQWGSGKGDGYPNAPGNWQRLASLGDGEVLAWIRK
jgi:hypothetical protein